MDIHIPCVRWTTQEKDTHVTKSPICEHYEAVGDGIKHTQTLLKICNQV